MTGDEAAKVVAAVQAKDSTATVTEVRKDPDGSYDAVGTKAGAPVMYDVSADLATVTENAGGGPGGGSAPNGSAPNGSAPNGSHHGSAPNSSSSGSSSSGSSTATGAAA